jgi:large subunit ribosomal protein L25
MRKDITVAAATRESRGKNEANRTRMAGNIPAVLYGAGGKSVPVTLSPKDINKILHQSTGHNTIFDLDVAGTEKSPVMIVDWLHHPVTSRLLHVDLKRIDLAKRLHVKVPVHMQGDPHGVKIQGGVFEVINRDIEIECLPDDIPESFTIDVSGMNLSDALRASEVPLTGSMKLLSVADMVLAHVVSLRAEVVATPDAAVVADGKVEPEVAKKGKKEDEAAPAAGGKAPAAGGKAPAAGGKAPPAEKGKKK